MLVVFEGALDLDLFIDGFLDDGVMVVVDDLHGEKLIFVVGDQVDCSHCSLADETALLIGYFFYQNIGVHLICYKPKDCRLILIQC